MADLTDRSTHFEFGRNWLSYSRTITEDSIARAERSVRDLFPIELNGRTFLDIGCGSGLFSLAALRLGARSVRAVDIDENSVLATRQLLTTHSPSKDWRVDNVSILEAPAIAEQYDVVYSWGVLHHTGAMWRAVEKAARLVRPGGYLAIALYRKTYLCRLWAAEKRLYSAHPKTLAPVANALFKGAWASAQILRGRNPLARIRSYHSARGMSWSHDVHDWLGGYPYESASQTEVVDFVGPLGFTLSRANARPRKEVGVFGSGCDEYVFQRHS